MDMSGIEAYYDQGAVLGNLPIRKSGRGVSVEPKEISPQEEITSNTGTPPLSQGDDISSVDIVNNSLDATDIAPVTKTDIPAHVNKRIHVIAFLVRRYGAAVVEDGKLTDYGLDCLIKIVESAGITPWELPNWDEGSTAATYSMFPIRDELGWEFYCLQKAQMWDAAEIDLLSDRETFWNFPERYQEFIADILCFFAPGDGLISRQVMRYLAEATDYEQTAFLQYQNAIEATHSEGYGMMIMVLFPDPERQHQIFGAVDTIPCFKAKAAFIEAYMNSDRSRGLRFIAGAATEGVFFVGPFCSIFYIRQKGIAPQFCFLNEQVSKDEVVHRDFNARRAGELGQFTKVEAIQVLSDAIRIEMDAVKYLLRKPLDSAEADAAGGLTIENLYRFTCGLSDQILIQAGLGKHFTSETGAPYTVIEYSPPWMKDLSLARRPNFYEVKVGAYKRTAFQTSINWKKRCGIISAEEAEEAAKEAEIEAKAVSNPEDVDF